MKVECPKCGQQVEIAPATSASVQGGECSNCGFKAIWCYNCNKSFMRTTPRTTSGVPGEFWLDCPSCGKRSGADPRIKNWLKQRRADRTAAPAEKVGKRVIKKYEQKETEPRLTYTALFDRKKYGINLYVGVGFLGASIISWFSWGIVYLLQGHKPIYQPFDYYVWLFIKDLLLSASFLAVSYLIRKNWLLPLIWGLCLAISFSFCRLAITYLFPQLQIPSFDFNTWAQHLAISFINGFFFMAGLIIAIHFWKIKPWSLIIGLAIPGVIWTIVAPIVFQAISFELSDIFIEIIYSTTFGVLLYAGFAVHFRRKSIEQLPSFIKEKRSKTEAKLSNMLHEQAISNVQQAISGKWKFVGIEGFGPLGAIVELTLPRELEFFLDGTFSGSSAVKSILSSGLYEIISGKRVKIQSTSDIPEAADKKLEATVSDDQLLIKESNTEKVMTYRRA